MTEYHITTIAPDQEVKKHSGLSMERAVYEAAVEWMFREIQENPKSAITHLRDGVKFYILAIDEFGNQFPRECQLQIDAKKISDRK